MGQLEDMAMFIRIVEAGGISKAADQLDIAKSAVSRRLTDLEKRLDTQLLSRTTRKSALTEAGSQYYKQAQLILDEVALLNEQTSGIKTKIEGTLKISAPLSFGLLHLSPLLDRYAKQHPGLGIQIDFSDRHIDLVEEGFEMAIRIGHLQDSSYQAKRLTPVKVVLCASPAYLDEHGSPKHPDDLCKHSFLQYGLQSETTLVLVDKKGQQQTLRLDSKMSANNGDFLKEMALNGHGITFLPTFIAYKELSAGKLIPVLTDYHLPHMYAYAVYPKNRFLTQRCRLLIDFLRDEFGDEPYWDREEK